MPTDPVLPPPPVPAPTPLEQLAAPTTVNLKAFRAAREAVDPPASAIPLEAVTPGPVDPPPAERPAEPPAAPRDAQGRFQPASPAPEAAAATAPPAAPDRDDEGDADAPDDARPLTRSTFQKRLAKERWQRGELERRLAALQDRVAQLTPPPPAPVAAPAPAAPRVPTYDDYLRDHPEASYDEYVDARAEARIDERLAADRQRLEADTRTRSLTTALHQLSTLGPSRHADFEAVQDAAYQAGIQWAPHVTDFVLRGTASPAEAADLTYALLKDPGLVDRLNRLPPARVAYELGRLPLGPAAAPTGPVVAPAPVTRAPDPITPVGTSAPASPLTPESLVKATTINLKQFRHALGR